jgi:hypothetical protein
MGPASQRGKYVWLGLLGVVVAIVSLASVAGAASIPPAVALGIVAAYLAVALLSVVKIDLSALTRQAQPGRVSASMTAAARKAWQRARNRPEYGMGPTDTLVDIGFLVNDKIGDGSWDRRIAAAASFDDGYVQPYLKVNVSPDYTDRNVMIDFEIYDRLGRLQFSHRVEEFLREGENLILCDRQLALRGNETLGRAGTWDMRVKVDGALAAIHEFNMAASDAERREQVRDNGEALRDVESAIEEEDEAVPVSLEDLLREQARRTTSRR